MMRAVSPRSLDEAIRYLSESPELRPVAGCTDLMVANPQEIDTLPAVMDLLSVPELRGIRWVDEILELGATTTFAEISASKTVQQNFPALADAAAQIGGWQIQNRATLGGNIANASPAGDSLPVLLALDASVVLVGPKGERTVAYNEFHVGYRRTVMESGEIIGRIRLPRPGPDAVQLFRKVGTREAHAISKVVVAVLGRLAEGRVAEYRLGAGSVAPVPVRLNAVEEAVIGRPAEVGTADLAGRIAAESVTPIDDVRSTAAYRRFALERVVRRLTLGLFA
jgi:CO/xanthine dehydrogenase FAD-binding subunit